MPGWGVWGIQFDPGVPDRRFRASIDTEAPTGKPGDVQSLSPGNLFSLVSVGKSQPTTEARVRIELTQTVTA
jgi:hypothetical protein